MRSAWRKIFDENTNKKVRLRIPDKLPIFSRPFEEKLNEEIKFTQVWLQPISANADSQVGNAFAKRNILNCVMQKSLDKLENLVINRKVVIRQTDKTAK